MKGFPGEMPEKELTIKIKFPQGASRPTESELVRFLVRNNVVGDDVTALYPDMRLRSYFVKFIDMQKADEFLKDVGCDAIFEFSNKVKAQVVISEANVDLRYVRIYEVAPEYDDEVIRKAMQAYGEIKKIVWEKSRPMPGFELYNGIRGVHIDMKKPVPNFVDICGESKRVAYPGMTELCFRCRKSGHKSLECPLTVNGRMNLFNKNAVVPPNPEDFDDFPALPRSPSLDGNGDKSVISDTPKRMDTTETNQTVDLTVADKNSTTAAEQYNTPPALVMHQPADPEKVNDDRKSRTKERKENDSKSGDQGAITTMSQQARERLRDRSNFEKGNKSNQPRSRSPSRTKPPKRQ